MGLVKVRKPQLEAFKGLRRYPGLRFIQGGKEKILNLEIDATYMSLSKEQLCEIAKTQYFHELARMDIWGWDNLISEGKSVKAEKLQPCLQLLANLIVHEVHLAVQWFHDHYSSYVLANDITMSDDKVRRVMAAMQGEITREALRVQAKEYHLDQLPFERQRSLAAKRREWFRTWGIGQEEWERNSFSLWNIPESLEVPDGS